MKVFKLKISESALLDIEQSKDWYDQQQKGLGDRFQNHVIQKIELLKTNPLIYNIRYNEIRCLVIDQFPFMVHFYADEENSSAEVLAVINTSRDPKIWKEKTK